MKQETHDLYSQYSYYGEVGSRKPCLICGETMVLGSVSKKYCSDKCKKEATKQRRHEERKRRWAEKGVEIEEKI
jgi:predicted nucleic acid-binding Zn ribbon protein